MSLRQAINAKCRDCVYDPLAGGTWLQQVIDCTCTDCPLYPVRPQRKPSAAAALQSHNNRDSRACVGKRQASGTTPAESL